MLLHEWCFAFFCGPQNGNTVNSDTLVTERLGNPTWATTLRNFEVDQTFGTSFSYR